MGTILIVDDSRFDRELATALLRDADVKVREAENGREALEAIEQDRPMLVLTDMLMPEVDGLALTRAVCERFPGLPVILMTAHGSEDTASLALRAGAAGYVPKRHLADDLLPTLRSVLRLSRAMEARAVADGFLERLTTEYVLGNDADPTAALTGQVLSEVNRIHDLDETESMQVAVALAEALSNAMHHGNLEVRSQLREESYERYLDEIEARRKESPYADRKVFLTVNVSRAEAAFTVRDEGRGFDPEGLVDPKDPDNMDRVHGRGLLLIRTFMDEVRHNETGNAITFIHRAG